MASCLYAEPSAGEHRYRRGEILFIDRRKLGTAIERRAEASPTLNLGALQLTGRFTQSHHQQTTTNLTVTLRMERRSRDGTRWMREVGVD